MNVYDFDNTIYDGESVFDFYIFCAKRRPALFRYIFTVLSAWAKYKLMLLSREKLMELAGEYAARLISQMSDSGQIVKEFWDCHENKIKPFYLENKRPDDVIVSASVGFLLREICNRLGVERLVCSEIDPETGKVSRLCYRQNKPYLFAEDFPNEKIDNFYSDSMNDLPMMSIATNAFLVKGDKVKPVPKSKTAK